MRYTRKISFPRAMLKKLTEDITRLIWTNEGSLSVLEIVEEIPYDIRADVIEGLSSFYEPALAAFFRLVQMEYGTEFGVICQRALAKYALAGIDPEFPPAFKNTFYRAFASTTRHTGRMTLDIAWLKPDGRLYVECFYLAFGSDGVHSFFVIEDMPAREYLSDRENQADMVALSYEESCLLIQDAYNFNVRFMSRPALGKFLYQKYLDEKCSGELCLVNVLGQYCSPLSPRLLVNSFFHALRCQDFNYLFSILDESTYTQAQLLQQINRTMNPGALLLEGRVDEVKGSASSALINAHAIILSEREVFRSDFVFELTKRDEANWLIAGIERSGIKRLDQDSELNPFSMQVYCRVYEIMDLDELFEVLDRVDNIREVEELPYGMHMRVTNYEDDFNHGVTFMTGVIADMVINGDEFVVISQQEDTLADFHNLFMVEASSPLLPRGEYEMRLTSAYSYLNGQYLQFEDILLDVNDELAFEDGMRFITARYVVKDRARVLDRLQGLQSLQFEIPGQFQVYYQIEEGHDQPGFMAEYLLGSNWVTVSAFGDRDMGVIRLAFEKDMYDALEFDGLEIREDGIFAILSAEVKRIFPQLESTLKEIYLNKWYHSHMPNLSGMSPSEACQTEEGTRLLWTMFKRIKKKEQLRRMRGERKQIGLKEYLRKLNLPLEGEN